MQVDVKPASLTFYVVSRDARDEHPAGAARREGGTADEDEIQVPWDTTQEGAELTLTNNEAEDSIVFAVRTNAPGQFVVRNKEGLLAPGESATVMVAIRRSARRQAPQVKSRFLFQCAVFRGVDDKDRSGDGDSNADDDGGQGDAEALHAAALRLGKEWRGRNIDLYHSKSVVVPCALVTRSPTPPSDDLAAKEQQLDGAIAKRRREIALLDRRIAAVKGRCAALEELVEEEAGRRSQRRSEAAPSMGQRLMEVFGFGIFLCSTAILVVNI